MPQNISTCPISCAGVELDGDANTYPAKNEPWLQQSLTSFGQGVRRSDQERLFLWINYVCTGVVSGKKLVFTLDQVTQFLHSFPRNAVAVVLLPNRASDLRSSPKLLRSKSILCVPFSLVVFVGVVFPVLVSNCWFSFNSPGKRMETRRRKSWTAMWRKQKAECNTYYVEPIHTWLGLFKWSIWGLFLCNLGRKWQRARWWWLHSQHICWCNSTWLQVQVAVHVHGTAERLAGRGCKRWVRLF